MQPFTDMVYTIMTPMEICNGYLWLATDGSGIFMLAPQSHQFSQLYHIVGDYSSLPVNSITVLYKDKEDELWAGSVRGGIFSIKETYIKTYKDVAFPFRDFPRTNY